MSASTKYISSSIAEPGSAVCRYKEDLFGDRIAFGSKFEANGQVKAARWICPGDGAVSSAAVGWTGDAIERICRLVLPLLAAQLLEEVLLCEFDLCNAECAATERDILSKFCFRILR